MQGEKREGDTDNYQVNQSCFKPESEEREKGIQAIHEDHVHPHKEFKINTYQNNLIFFPKCDEWLGVKLRIKGFFGDSMKAFIN
jgi:hypothetical protein